MLQPLLPFIRDELNLSYAEAGWIVSAFTLTYGFSQLPAGWLADRIGARLLITIGISGVALTGIFTGLSPSYTFMVIALMAMGILGGGYHPSASPLVSNAVDTKNRGRALGLHQIGGTASNFVAPLVAVPLAIIFGSWRGSFISLGMVILVFGIVFFFLLGKQSHKQKEMKPQSAVQTQNDSHQYRIVRLVPFIILGIIIQVTTFSSIGFISLFAVDQLSASKEIGAALIALAQVAGLFAGPLGGYLSDRIGKIPVMLTVAFLAGPMIYLLSHVSLGWSISVVLLIIGICQYVAMPVSEAYIISHSPNNKRSTILGFYYFASRGGPGLLMPAMGWVSDNYSFATTFTIVGLATLIVVGACSLTLLRHRN